MSKKWRQKYFLDNKEKSLIRHRKRVKEHWHKELWVSIRFHNEFDNQLTSALKCFYRLKNQLGRF